MAGMTAERLRLTTSRSPSYRRAGVKIGSYSAPTFIGRGDVTVGQLLAIVQDPNIALAFEYEDGTTAAFTAEARAEFEAGLLQVIELDGPDRTLGAEGAGSVGEPTPLGEPITAEPQGEGLPPAAEASQASGADAAPKDSAGSAAGAVTSEPTAQASPTAPEPAAKPAPVSRGGGKKRGTTAA
ncbi:hypothetical protein ACLBKU_17455 [Erythrobacter sp. NE805]|uniref:hypothetical protein n=1 Tax=Erythrobacter sp. NE805 TaxID=3389875 RepID=UPI00396AFDE2